MLFGHLVDIERHSIYDAALAIQDGYIVEIQPLQDALPVEAPYILPGFVDSHIHIESTLLTPSRFAPLAVRQGTVAVVADPHEIANVLGVEGVDFMLQDSNSVRFGFHFCVPSCVPSTPFETAGATLDSQAVKSLLQRDRVVGLAEMMNVPGVLFGDAEVSAKLQAAKELNKCIDGHAPLLSGDDLKKYVSAEISTDHECSNIQEAEEKLAAGMSVLIREGSAACNFEALAPLLRDYPDKLMFCTDDIYPNELQQGHINLLVRRAVAKGVPLWNVLKAACINPVRHYGLRTGLLRKGDAADFIMVDDLTHFNIISTYIAGVEVYSRENGVRPELFCKKNALGTPNQFCAKPLHPSALMLDVKDRKVRVITAQDGQLLTGCEVVAADHIGVENDILKLMVYNRYQSAKPQVTFIKGFGLNCGAFATTIAHDCHNLIGVGCSDEDLAAVLNRLIALKGGIAATDGTNTVDLPLPVAGLMSNQEGSLVAAQLEALNAMVRKLGCPLSAPFMTLSFMALPVIPALKLTDKGLFDGIAFAFTNLWVD